MSYNFVHNAFWVVKGQSWVQDLPINYKKAMIVFIFKKIIKTIYFFRLNINLTLELLPEMSLIRIPKKEFIYRQGDPADEIYFLLEGEVQYRNQFASQLFKISKGQFFGEQEFFSQKKKIKHDSRKLYAYCQTDVILLFFESNYFFDKLIEYPQLLDWVGCISQAREDKIQKIKTNMKKERQMEQMQRLKWEQIRNANNLYDTAYQQTSRSKQGVVYENSFTYTNRIISELINTNIRKKIQLKKKFQKVVRMVIFANRTIHKEVCQEKFTRKRRQMPRTLLMTQLVNSSISKSNITQTNSTYLNSSYNNIELSRILQDRLGNRLKNFKTLQKKRKLINIRRNGAKKKDDLTKAFIYITTGKRVRSTNLEQNQLEKTLEKLYNVRYDYKEDEKKPLKISFNKDDVNKIVMNLKTIKRDNEILGLSKWQMIDTKHNKNQDMQKCIELISKLDF